MPRIARVLLSVTDKTGIVDFARSLAATHSVGGSIYDWNSMAPATRQAMTRAFDRRDEERKK